MTISGQNSSLAAGGREWRRLTLVVAGLMIFLAIGIIVWSWPMLALQAPDTDSVLRLLEVKRLLAGDGWYAGLFEPRLAPPEGHWTHWSRLVDLPVAGLIAAARLVLPEDQAIRAAIAIWPIMVFAALGITVYATARRLAGEKAAALALIGCLTCAAGLSAFQPGDIDHHNVQTTLLLITVASVLALRDRAVAAIAGGLALAILTAVGLETLHVVIVIIGWLAFLLWRMPQLGARIGSFFLCYAAGSLLCFIVDTPPARWSFTACDAMALNYLGAALVGGIGLGLLGLFRKRLSNPQFFTVLAAVALATVIVFGWLDTACLAGPFARIKPELYPLWLDQVTELESFGHALLRNPPSAITSVVLPVTALGLVTLALRRNPRDPELWFFSAMIIGALIVSLLHSRAALETSWLSVPIAAALAIRILPASNSILLPFALASGLPLAACFFSLTFRPAQAGTEVMTTQVGCSDIAAFKALEALPPGLVLNDIDLGPNLLLRTPHRVMQAPYHRIQDSIILSERLMALPAQEGAAALKARQIDYVLLCGSVDYPYRPGRKDASSLLSTLREGAPVPGLSPIDLGRENPLRLWRVAN